MIFPTIRRWAICGLLAHISRDGSEIVLDDWFGDAAFLFGEEQFLPVKAVETA